MPKDIYDLLCENRLPPEDKRLVDLLTPKELGESTFIWDALEERGWLPPHPSRVLRGELPATLQRFVLDLSWLHVYLHCVDHLSDEDLYEELYDTIRGYPVAIWPEDPDSAITIHFALSDDDEGEVWLRYYATDWDRRIWAKTYPEHHIPPADLPRYRRDWPPVRTD